MKTLLHPNATDLIINLTELEKVLSLLSNPDKRHHIADTVSALRVVNMTEGSENATLTLVASIAWLTDTGMSS